MDVEVMVEWDCEQSSHTYRLDHVQLELTSWQVCCLSCQAPSRTGCCFECTAAKLVFVGDETASCLPSHDLLYGSSHAFYPSMDSDWFIALEAIIE